MIQRRKILCQFLILGQDYRDRAQLLWLWLAIDLPKLYLPWSPKIISVFHLFEICGLKIRSFCVKIHWTRRGQNRKFLWTNDFYSKLEYFLENGCLVNIANSSRLATKKAKSNHESGPEDVCQVWMHKWFSFLLDRILVLTLMFWIEDTKFLWRAYQTWERNNCGAYGCTWFGEISTQNPEHWA